MTERTPGALRPQHLFFGTSPHKGLAVTTSDNIVTFALRFLACLCGAAILAAASHAVIAAGKLAGPDALLVAALSAGVGIGAGVVSRARAGLAVAVVVALVCGEAFNLISSAERIVSGRDAAASQIKATNDRHADARAWLSHAQAALAAHRDNATEAVSLPSCARECRALLQAQGTEIAAEVETARKAVEIAPATRSATPLADRLGVAPWALDLIAAALLSVGANGLAAALIAWGARPGTSRAPSPIVIEPSTPCPARAIVPAVTFTDGTRDGGDDPRPPHGGLPVPTRTRGLLALIEGSGGTLAGSQRQIAERAGLSKTVLNRLLSELATAGHIELSADRMTGTKIRLRAA